CFLFVFFFSSRRRHTRSDRDWSSDVCSSDLWILLLGTVPLALAALLSLGLNGLMHGTLSPATSGSAGMLFGLGIDAVVLLYVRRSEERRVGKGVDGGGSGRVVKMYRC